MVTEDRLFSKILVPMDGSDQSMAAADKAIKLAKRDKAEIIILYVLQLPTVAHYTPSMLNDVIQGGRNEAEKWFGSMKSQAENNGIKVETKIAESVGSPTSIIVDYAKKEKIDLIVMGTRGKTKLKKIILGSVSSGVVTYAPCSVMVVR